MTKLFLLFKYYHLESSLTFLKSFWQAPSTLTGDPVADFFSLLLEDWADEYLWRPAMYYRWFCLKFYPSSLYSDLVHICLY